MSLFEDVPQDIAIMDNLTYIIYEYWRNRGLSHKVAIKIPPLADGMAEKYLHAYEENKGEKQ